MPPKKKKVKTAAKKPLKTFTRQAIIAWLVAIFIACGWMFALGVLVGRDQAPIKYDINAIEAKLSKLKQRESVTAMGGTQKKSGAPKSKRQLDFYEALPENREDTKLPRKPKPKIALKKQSSPAQAVNPSKSAKNTASAPKKNRAAGPSDGSPKPKVAAAEAAVYTIQASSVKNKPDADRLVRKLKKSGFPAYLLTSKVEGKGTWHRVRIGSYSNKTEATGVLNKLRQAGMKPILVKTK